MRPTLSLLLLSRRCRLLDAGILDAGKESGGFRYALGLLCCWSCGWDYGCGHDRAFGRDSSAGASAHGVAGHVLPCCALARLPKGGSQVSVVVQTFVLTLALASEVEGRRVHVHARAARKVRDLAEVCFNVNGTLISARLCRLHVLLTQTYRQERVSSLESTSTLR